jgi:hypothetical protein
LVFILGQAGAQTPTEPPATVDDPAEVAAGSDPGDDAALTAPPRYQVELIVFAHADAGSSQELFDHQSDIQGALEPLPRFDPDAALATVPFEPRADEAVTGATNPAADATDPAVDAVDPTADVIDPAAEIDVEDVVFTFRHLESEEFQLRNASDALERLGAYEVLGHVGWVQDGLGRNNATPMDLRTLGVSSPTGTVQLYLGRFLHVAVDLQYSPLGVAPPRPDAFGVRTFTGPPSYRLQTERNAIRSGELHYIDHPMFGLLVLVTRAAETDEAQNNDGGELAPAA